MSLIKWNQPSKLTSRRNWIENFFSEANEFLRTSDWDMGMSVPAVNVREESNAYQIEVSAPGMKKDDFKISVDNGVLNISAKTEERKEEKDNNYVRQEFSYSNFNRSFWLPETVNSEAIKANYDQGVLKLELPKMEARPVPKAKEIKIM